MPKVIITEYANVGNLDQSPITQSGPTPMFGEILAHQELDGSGVGQGSALFHPRTRVIKIYAIDEPVYFAFTKNPENVISGNRDYLDEKESIYHGVFDGDVKLYEYVSVSNVTDMTQ